MKFNYLKMGRIGKTTYYLRNGLPLLFFLMGSFSISAQLPEVKVYKAFDDMKKDYFDLQDGKVHVINFWATWCKPCIKELPYFEELTRLHSENVKVTLVSLDFPRKMDVKLKPFISQNNLQSEVVLLDDGRVNEWIDKVDPSWSGAIPATVLFYNGKKAFYEQEFHSTEELEKLITNIKSKN